LNHATIKENFYEIKNGGLIMNLTEQTTNNVEYMITAIKDKLRMVNVGAMRPENFDVELYEELKDIYDLVMKKETFSISEMEAIVSELGTLVKK
jgi:uncharacterized protein YfkK (UPF0435 family)